MAFALLWCGLAALPGIATSEAAMVRSYLGSFGEFEDPRSIAVDQSNGDVYVLDVKAKSVSRFDSTLAPKPFPALSSNVIDGAATLTCAPGIPSPNCDRTPFNGFSLAASPGSQVAVDDSGNPLTDGNVYVTDSGHEMVAVFASTGAYLGALTKAGAAGTALLSVCGVAVDSAGAVYTAQPNGGVAFAPAVRKFTPTGNPPTDADFTSEFIPSQPLCKAAFGAAGTAGYLFMNKNNTGPVSKLDATTGALQYQLSSTTTRGVAVDPTTGHVFTATGGEVREYDASGSTAPTLLDSFGSTRLTTAAGVAVDGARTRIYVADSSPPKVHVYGPMVTAVAPTVGLGATSPRSGGRMGLTGFIDSNDLATTYYFEYGPDDCASSPCTALPASRDAILGKGVGAIRVSRTITGLTPGTTYHYRLVAANSAGTTARAATFTTLETPSAPACANGSLRTGQGSEYLPDCRAFELVSAFPSAQRNATEPLLRTDRIRSATDGGAFQFASPTAAVDAAGVPFMTEYMTKRDAGTGWSVHGVTPPGESSTFNQLANGAESHYMGSVTDDLSRAVFMSLTPLNEEGPNVAKVMNLYRREDMLTPGAGRYTLLSDSVDPLPGDIVFPWMVGASDDLSQVVFESGLKLTADSASVEGEKLYKWVDGKVLLVGILPISEGGGPTHSRAARGLARGRYNTHSVSSDGSRVVFLVPPPFSNGTRAGQVYLRDDQGTASVADDATVKLNASEKTNGAGPGGTDPGGVQPAAFWDASTDLSQLFFTSSEALTNDAPVDQPTVPKLYRYDLDAPSGQHLTLLSVDQNAGDGIRPAADGVLGVSDDGSYVYFVGPNQLVAGRPLQSRSRIFVWHGGQVEQVAAINAGIEQERNLDPNLVAYGGKWSRVSPDGRHLLFLSEGTDELTGYDHGTTCPEETSTGCKEAYLYSAATAARGAALRCASCPSGPLATVDANINWRDVRTFVLTNVSVDSYVNRPLSSDGGSVFFTSAEKLSPFDDNESTDVYEFDAKTGAMQLLSGGKPNASAQFLDASSDGRSVFFATTAQLLPRDRDEYRDVYVARVGGGFPESTPQPTIPCVSLDGCRPPLSALTAEGPIESEALAAGKRRAAKKHRAKKRHGKHRHGKHRRAGRKGKRDG